MDFSIKDLIVPTERPTSGLGGIASQTALAGAASASTAAFNDLLNKYRPQDTSERSSDRVEVADRPNRDRNTDRAAPETERAQDHRDPTVTDTRKDAPERNQGTQDSGRHEKDSIIDDTKPTSNAEGLASLPTVIEAKSTPPSGALALPMDNAAKVPTTVLTGTPDQSQNTAPDKVTGGALAAATTQNGADLAQGRQGTPAPQVTATNASPQETTTKTRPVQFANFIDGNDALTESPLASTFTASPKSASTVKSPSNDRPVLTATAPIKGAERTSDFTTKVTGSQIDDGLSLTLRADADAPLSSIRGPQVPGLLAAQELSMQANQISENAQQSGTNASTKINAAQIAAQQPTSSTGTATPTPDVPIGLAAANIETHATTSNVRPTPGNSIHPLSMTALNQTTPAGATPVTSSLHTAARAPANVPVPLDEVAVHIARAAASGADQINIKLKPAALGQVEVKLELTHDGRVAAVISADRADTLDMLTRDSKGLERALADAGLKTDQGSLQFNLRGDTNHGGTSDRNAEPHDILPHASNPTTTNDILDMPAEAMNGYTNFRAGIGGVDITV